MSTMPYSPAGCVALCAIGDELYICLDNVVLYGVCVLVLCGSVWYWVPCWYQYWVLRGDSHGHWERSFSNHQDYHSEEDEEDGELLLSASSYIILATGVELQLVSNI